MSILDSKAEIAAAKAKLEASADDALVTDLTYWSVAAKDHADEYHELAQRQARVRDLYAEAEQWVGLIVAEIRRRRDAKRAGAGR